MILLLAGLLLFIGIHSTRLCASDWRARFIAQHGDRQWRLLYTVVSVVGLVLIVYGYGLSRANPVFLWNPPLWTRHLALTLTLIAFILLAATYVPRNHLKQKLGHPMYAGVKLWAFAHLIANGRLGDVLLFGVFLVWAIGGFAISRKRDRLSGIRYPQGTMSGTLATVVTGTVAWAAFAFFLHRMLIGVAPL